MERPTSEDVLVATYVSYFRLAGHVYQTALPPPYLLSFWLILQIHDIRNKSKYQMMVRQAGRRYVRLIHSASQ